MISGCEKIFSVGPRGVSLAGLTGNTPNLCVRGLRLPPEGAALVLRWHYEKIFDNFNSQNLDDATVNEQYFDIGQWLIPIGKGSFTCSLD